MNNIQLALIVSIITTLLSVLAMQCKRMAQVRTIQFMANALLVLQYVLTDNISAAGVCITAIAHVIIAIIFQQKQKRFPKLLTAFFMLLYVIISLMNYEKAPDVLTGVAACCFALSVAASRNEYYRICSTTNCTVWLIFDLWSATYTAVILHLTLFIIDVFTIIRLDRKFWGEKLFVKK